MAVILVSDESNVNRNQIQGCSGLIKCDLMKHRKRFLYADQPEAEKQRPIHLFHRLGFEFPHTVDQPPFVDGADLVQENDRFGLQPALGWPDKHLSRIERLFELRGNRSNDGDRARAVGDVVLQNQRWVRL